jgi:hypothetical protein
MEEHIELKIDPVTGEILGWETPADIQEDKVYRTEKWP